MRPRVVRGISRSLENIPRCDYNRDKWGERSSIKTQVFSCISDITTEKIIDSVLNDNVIAPTYFSIHNPQINHKQRRKICGLKCVDDIYLTAVGLTPGGSSTTHIYTQTVHLHTNSTHNTEIGKWYRERNIGKCGPCPVLRIIPWHLPYNWGKSTEKPQLG
jgi:hypothetical protein